MISYSSKRPTMQFISCITMMMTFLLFSLGCGLTTAFTTTTSVSSARTISDRYSYILHSSTTQDGEQTVSLDKSIDPKDAVRVFGRLAEKYIMLDESGGMCCYSACKDCEYRLPDGGYCMADQRSSRPKWIPVYEERVFAGQNKEHIAKWKTGIFGDGENSQPSVSKEEFVSALVNLEYVPPLGGPFVAASGGTLEDTTVVEHLFDLLSNGKEKLSRHKMSLQLKQMADGEQGLTWPSFQSALGL